MASKTRTTSAPAIDGSALLALLSQAGVDVASLVSGVEVEAAPAKRTPAKRTMAQANRDTAKAKAKRSASRTNGAKRTNAKRTCNITAREAWEALGADPEFEPRDPDKPASGPMLWRLNANGELASLLS